MNSKKLAIGAVMTVALTSGGGIATAAIPGVVGEAALVPAVFSGSPDDAPIHTYVGLYVPEVVGTDTVINQYTAPNAAPGTTTQVFEGTKAIHWTLFDNRSKKIEDGDCDASPGDVVLWSTDPAVRMAQQEQRRGLLQEGILGLPDGVPDPVCGPTNTGWRIGYVVFQTRKGASREAADFAFAGYASIIERGVLSERGSIGSVPVLPMADGSDAVYPEIQYLNSVVQKPGPTDVPSVPEQVAPIVAGIRMNDANGEVDQVRMEAPIQGPGSGYGRSIHFFWFDNNKDDRFAYITGWDDQEGPCTNGKPMPDEMDIVIYNQYVAVPAGFGSLAGWENIAPKGPGRVVCEAESSDGCYSNDGGYRTQLITAVQPPTLFGYASDEYCEPPYWLPVGEYPGALSGNITYEFDEEGEPATPGLVNSAMMSFTWQESLRFGEAAWASDPTTALGIIAY